ncbi:hypothetical protein PG996_008738 [Apiospora saccharicola]|uniref:BTB domain-containing protein n=1 Tax=Apiospora saccharicola TaxID=335842 RepID=A0ABR1V1C8_9PEZI
MAELPQQDIPAQDGPASNLEADLIRLQVGECQFTTTLNTLTAESTFFTSMFSGDWNNPKTADGAVFIDSDGQTFRHILTYLRSGRFPLFYDASNHEFDFAQYQKLLGEAKFFGIPRLQQWIEQHRYRDAIEVQHNRQVFNSEYAFDSCSLSASTRTAGSLTHHSYSRGMRKVYICPRGIDCHRGRSDACGHYCHAEQVGKPMVFEEEPYFKGVVVTTSYILKPDVCLGEDFTPDH